MDKTKKDCYGVLDKVFPIGSDGLREVVAGCFDCPVKRECLQDALKTKDGLGFRAQLLERAPAEGVTGFLRRWSQMKEINRRLKEEKR
ncbi:hypothetical protein GW860_13080 [bacterium]|nr:hypothetical protein [bacterium]NCP09814.1 hypothetical protein [bacterium]